MAIRKFFTIREFLQSEPANIKSKLPFQNKFLESKIANTLTKKAAKAVFCFSKAVPAGPPPVPDSLPMAPFSALFSAPFFEPFLSVFGSKESTQNLAQKPFYPYFVPLRFPLRF